MTQPNGRERVDHEDQVEQIDVSDEVERQDDAYFDDGNAAEPDLEGVALADCSEVAAGQPDHLKEENDGFDDH